MICMFRRVVENTSLNYMYMSQAVLLSTCASIAASLTVIAEQEEYPLLQWHPRFREEASLPDSLSPLALGTPPHTSIRVPSEIFLVFPSRIATLHEEHVW